MAQFVGWITGKKTPNLEKIPLKQILKYACHYEKNQTWLQLKSRNSSYDTLP